MPKVKDFIAHLQREDPEAEVVLNDRDFEAEGNYVSLECALAMARRESEETE